MRGLSAIAELLVDAVTRIKSYALQCTRICKKGRSFQSPDLLQLSPDISKPVADASMVGRVYYIMRLSSSDVHASVTSHVTTGGRVYGSDKRI